MRLDIYRNKVHTMLAVLILSILILFLCFIGIEGQIVTALSEDISDISGLQVHLDAQSFELTNGEKVSSINNNATPTLDGVGGALQSNVDRQPVYVASSNLNGKPAIRFNNNSYMQIGSDSGFYLEDMTIFVVTNFNTIPAHGEILSRVAYGSPWNHNWFFNLENGFNFGWAVRNNGYYNYPKNTVAINANETYILAARKNNLNGRIYVNGIPMGDIMGADPEEVSVNMTVGLGSLVENDSFIGDFGEALIFDRGLSDSEIIRVEQFLEKKWDMTNIHEGQLSSISIKGEEISSFSPMVTDYSYVAHGYEVSIEDIGFKLWNSDDSAEVTQNGHEFTITVTGSTTSKTKEYKIMIKHMDYDFNEIEQLNSNEVKLNDGFWSPLYRQYSIHTVNFMFDMFDMSKSFENFDRVARGEKKVLNNTSANAGQVLRPRNDLDVFNTDWEWISEPWREGLIYEGIRAASQFIMVNQSDSSYQESVSALQNRVSDYIDRIYAASLQTTFKDGSGKPIDGYFSTFTILDRTHVIDETDVTARFHHDVYNYGCLTEAAIYWYNATGDTRLLFAAVRFTEFLIDYINGRDGYTGYKVVPSHQLPEEALQNLYDLLKNNPLLVKLIEGKYSKVDGLSSKDRYYNLEIRLEQYKDIAKSWITDRGNYEGRYNNTSYGVYAQDNLVYSEITEAVGHSVRANLWYNGIAIIGNRQENLDFVNAAQNIWHNIVSSQMYVTGGTGSTNDGEEAYGGSNELPHNGYCETCASVAMSFFAQSMFNIMGKAEYADIVELEMYNNILGSLGLDGNSFYYTNPMVSGVYVRPMFSNATPCCVPMFLKYYSELPEIIYAKTNDIMFVNQYISSSAQTKVGDANVLIMQDTDMPNGNKAYFSVTTDKDFDLKLRVPSWASGYVIKVNGKQEDLLVGEDGYINVPIENGKTRVEIVFNKEVQRIYQDYAKANQGKVAFRYGPMIYCAEETDNNFFLGMSNYLRNASIGISKNEDIEALNVSDMFEIYIDGKNAEYTDTNILKVRARAGNRDIELTLIPFYLRGNRESGSMCVWFTETE